MADLFISYSRRDSDFVRDLHAALAARGADVWVDWEDIPPAWDWKEELRDGIERAQVLVFVISPDSLQSSVCGNELDQAVAHGKRVVPVVRRDPDGEVVPPVLADRNWIFFRETDDFDAGVARLVAAIETDQGWVREHTRLLTRATEWDRADRPGALLLRGSALTTAERALAGWREGTEPAPTALQQEYVAAGRRGSARRTRALLAASAVALAISVVLGVLALLERNKAIDREQSAQSRSLAVEALLRAESDPDLSVALALEAVDRDRTEQAEEALRRSVSQLQARGSLKVSKESVDVVSVRSTARVLALAADGTARLWDQRNGRSRTLPMPDGEIAGAQLDAGGNRILLAARSGATLQDIRTRRTVTMRADDLYGAHLTRDGRTVLGMEGAAGVVRFDTATGERRSPRLEPRDDEIVTLGGDRTGRVLLGGYQDGTIRVWDARAGTVLHDHRADPAQAQAIAPSGRFAVTVAGDGLGLDLWSTRTGRVRHELKGHSLLPLDVAISSDSKLVAAGAQDNTARIWHADSGRPLRVLRGHGDSVTYVGFSRDGRRLLTVSNDETARVWSVKSGETLAVLRGHDGDIASADLTADGRYVVTGGADGTVRLWEASPGRTLAALPHDGPIEAAALDPRGSVVASSGPDRIQYADADTGAVLAQDKAAILTKAPTTEIAFDAERRYMAVADGFYSFVFDVISGDFGYLQHGSTVNSMAWTRDGATLVTAAADGTARLVDPKKSDTARRTLRAGGPLVRALPTPDGRRVVTLVTDGEVRVFDARTGDEVERMRARAPASDLSLSPDGRTVAVAGDDAKALLWRPEDGDDVRALEHGEYVSTVRFSRDGRRVATASGDGAARVWDAATGRLVHTLRSHEQPVRDVDFSPDGRFLLSAGDDSRALLWDLTTGRVVGIFGGHDGGVRRARFSADGRKVLTVPTSGAAAVFACDACQPLDALVERARRLVPRLSERERSRFLD